MESPKHVVGLTPEQWNFFNDYSAATKDHFVIKEAPDNEYSFKACLETPKPVIYRKVKGFIGLQNSVKHLGFPGALNQFIVKSVTNKPNTKFEPAHADRYMDGKTIRSDDVNSIVWFADHSLPDQKTYVADVPNFIQRNYCVSSMHVDQSYGTCISPEEFGAIKIWVMVPTYRYKRVQNFLSQNSRQNFRLTKLLKYLKCLFINNLFLDFR